MPDQKPQPGDPQTAVDQQKQAKRKRSRSPIELEGSTCGVIHLPVDQPFAPPFDPEDDPHGIRNEVHRLVIEHLILFDRIHAAFAKFRSIQYSFEWQEKVSEIRERHARLFNSFVKPFEKWFDSKCALSLKRQIDSAIETAAESDDLKAEVKIPLTDRLSDRLLNRRSSMRANGRLGFRFKCTLTLMEAVGQSEEVVKAKVSDQKEWSSTLSMEEALSVLNDHKSELAELPESIFPAISTLVIDAQQKRVAYKVNSPNELAAVEANDVESEQISESQPRRGSAKDEKQIKADQIDQLSEIADLTTSEVKANLTKMNNLLRDLAHKNFQSRAQIAQLVDSLQLIMRRGEFDLKLTEKVLRWKKGTHVYVSLKKPSEGYPIGRMGVYPVGAPSDARHRVKCFPLELSPVDA